MFRSFEKPKTPERSGGQEITEVVEAFINRAKKLEADFLMYESNFSIHEFIFVSLEAILYLITATRTGRFDLDTEGLISQCVLLAANNTFPTQTYMEFCLETRSQLQYLRLMQNELTVACSSPTTVP